MVNNNDLFKKIKSIFILEDGAQPVADPSATSSTPQPEQELEPKVSSVDSSKVEGGKVEMDPKYTDFILKSLENNNLEGFDYFEFKSSLKSLANVIPDETLRYKSAFEMAKTMGVNKEKLLESAEYYLKVLSDVESGFSTELNNRKKTQIDARNSEFKQLEQQIADKNAKIEALKAEIAKTTKQLDEIKKEIAASESSISMTGRQFNLSYNMIYNQIVTDLEKIKANL